MGDGTHAEVVATVQLDGNGNIVGNPADRELRDTEYICKQAFTGAVVGNVISRVVEYDVAGSTLEIVSVLFENLTTGQVIAAPPNIPAYLERKAQGDGLTFTELQSAGLGTAANQNVQTGLLADLAGAAAKDAKTTRYTTYKTQEVDKATAGTVYIRKAGPDTADTWLIVRIVKGATGAVFSYAGIRNNPAITTPTVAWTARASLTYGDLSAA